MTDEQPFDRDGLFRDSYDLDDPRGYVRVLAPLAYRMPGVACRLLRRARPALAAAFAKPEPRLLDFACGFGVNGALLKHDLSLGNFYRHFTDGDPASDQALFAARRASGPGFQVGGLDIAGRALAYGQSVGFLDAVFQDDLSTAPPGPGLAAFLAETDLVLETGAPIVVFVPALERLLAALALNRRPWILSAPRPDVDQRPLEQLLARHGYRRELCNDRPFLYRQLSGPAERAAATRAITGFGRDPAQLLRDGHFLVDLWLARPVAEIERLPLAQLLAEVPQEIFHTEE